MADRKQIAADRFTNATEHGEYLLDGDYIGVPVKKALGEAKDTAVDLAGLHAAKAAPTIQPTAIETRIESPQA